MSRFDVIAFDGDDTLWHNERLFVIAQDRFKELLARRFQKPEWIDERLYQTEMRNLPFFGYGIKGFTLSMIETAIELTEGHITGTEIQTIIDTAKGIMGADVELLDHVRETVEVLSVSYRLMLINKGDLRDQEKKVARSGLHRHFRDVEILSDKSRDTYEAILRRHALPAARFLMIGNSIRSDILPVIELGGSAVHIPYPYTWTHEVADPPPTGRPGFHALAHMGLLPDLLMDLEHRS
jgi:putative hydrolase of the HAD superfamily